ncbi:hypothetical protein Tco_0957548 [Tanacetum coccineum]
MIDSQMDDMIKERLALKEQVDLLEQNLSKQIREKESLLQTITAFKNKSKEKENKYMKNEIDLEKKIKELDNINYKVGYQNPFYLKKAQRIKPTLYDGVVISNKHVAMPVIDDEDTLILEDESRSKMSKKAKDPDVIAKKISHKPIDYEKLNRLTEDFRKHFTPQQELSAEQAFLFHILNPTIKPSYIPPVIVDVPSELPKMSLVNTSLKKVKFHLAQFDSVVKKRTTPNAREADLLNEITEVQTVFDQMQAAVQQSSVDKQCLKIAKKELLENDRLLQKIMSQDVLLSVMISMSLNGESVNIEMQRCESCDKCLNLDAEQSIDNDPNAEYALSRLLQRGTVVEYQKEFEMLISRVMGKSDSLLASIYIFGLKPALQQALLWSKPITLGEAFSLASITKARFEDKRSITDIAKTNYLNVRVPVQDLKEMIRHKPNKIEAFQTSMVATFEEHEQQENQDNLNEFSEEKDDAKPPVFIDTVGNNGDNDSRTLGLETPAKEVVDNVEQKSLGNWKELDNESKDRKVERDAKREGEYQHLATFASIRV